MAFVLVNVVFGFLAFVVAILFALAVWSAVAATGLSVPRWWVLLALLTVMPISYSVALDWAFGAFRRDEDPEQDHY